MKKRYRNIIISLLIFVVVLFVIFGGTYYFLATRFIANKVALDFEYKVENKKEVIENRINNDYFFFNNYVKTLGNLTNEEIINDLNDNDQLKSQFKVNSIKVGYFDDNSFRYLNANYTFKNVNDYTDYYKRMISIYSLQELFDISDNNRYVVMRYNNFAIFIDAFDYLNSMLEINTNDNYYIIFENTGHIVFQQDIDSQNDILYFDYINNCNVKFDYSKISDKLYNGESGYEILNFNGKKSIFTFSPILKDVFNQDLFIGYAFEYYEAVKSMEYLNVAFIVLSASMIITIALVVGVAAFKTAAKEQDVFNLTGIRSLTKPFTIKINKKGKIVFANKSCYRNVKNFNEYKTINDFEMYEQYDEIMSLVTAQKSFTIIFKSFTDENIYVHIVPLKMFNHYFLMGDDMSSTLKEQIHNRQIALYNSVTNLPNGNLLKESLEKLVSSPVFATSNVSIAAIEIVDFSKINRLYGYASADTMVRGVAEIINDSIKDMTGTIDVYNIRTSLFVVVFIDTLTHNEIIAWSKRLIEKLEEPINIRNDYLVQISPKMGLFTIPIEMKNTITDQEIYDNAIVALERSKSSNISKISIYNNDLGKALSRDQIMEEDLQEAIKNDEFEMFYQPQFNVKTGKIVGVESLIRWDNPKYKNESPEKFITLAEKNGMIIELGTLIINKVFKYAKTIENSGISVSLNVSPVQLLQSGFVYELLKSYEDYELKPGLIAIEITETFLMENKDIMISKMRLLKDKGFKIHLDDFGIGYSSMFYLKDLPVDAIKIDKEFLKYMVSDKATKAIVSKIVQLGLSLNLELIAEGVETDKQKDMLLKMGCEIIQGYLISKPINTKESYKIIKKINNYEVKRED